MSKKNNYPKNEALNCCVSCNFSPIQSIIFLLVKEDLSYIQIGTHSKVGLTGKQVGKQVELMIKKVNKCSFPNQEKVYSMFGVYKRFKVYSF